VEGVLDFWLVTRLTEISKALFYKERRWGAILRLASARGLPPMPLHDFAAWLPTGQADQKRLDALEVIAAIRAHLLAGVTSLRISYLFQDTGYHKAAAQSSMKA
jgi:hypothetical protein